MVPRRSPVHPDPAPPADTPAPAGDTPAHATPAEAAAFVERWRGASGENANRHFITDLCDLLRVKRSHPRVGPGGGKVTQRRAATAISGATNDAAALVAKAKARKDGK